MDYVNEMDVIDFGSRIEYNGQWTEGNKWNELWSEGSNMECVHWSW